MRRDIPIPAMSVPQLFELMLESVRVAENIAQELARLFGMAANVQLNGAGPDRARVVRRKSRRRDAVTRFVSRRYTKGKAAKAERLALRRKALKRLPKHFTTENIEKVLKLTGHDRSRWLGQTVNAGHIKVIGKGVYEQVAQKE